MRKTRNDFDILFAKSVFDLRKAGLSINEITFNKNYNTKSVSPQRISQIINAYEKFTERSSPKEIERAVSVA